MTDLSAWPALVLTAGLATRLRPLSDVRAKGALPVAGEVLVARILRWLGAAGVRRVVLNLHHRPETITRRVGDGAEWGLDVRYSWEQHVLGSAGGPRRALPLLEADRFLIVNGDTLTDCDLSALAAQHLETGARATLAVVEGDTGRYGGVLVDELSIVRGFARGGTAMRAGLRSLHFIGAQAVDASVFVDLPDDRPSESIREVYPALMAAELGSVRALESRAEFLDVGTPADYLATVEIVAARENRALDRGESCRIDPSATVERSVLWDRVTVSAGARLTQCVVADDVVIPAGEQFERAAIVNGPSGLTVRPI